MAHPFADKAKTGQELADSRYPDKLFKSNQGSERDASGMPDEEWTGAPARQVSNLGNVRK